MFLVVVSLSFSFELWRVNRNPSFTPNCLINVMHAQTVQARSPAGLVLRDRRLTPFDLNEPNLTAHINFTNPLPSHFLFSPLSPFFWASNSFVLAPSIWSCLRLMNHQTFINTWVSIKVAKWNEIKDDNNPNHSHKNNYKITKPSLIVNNEFAKFKWSPW